MRSFFRRRAFTLIELLVVISLIAILATLVLIESGQVRMRGRDADRRSSLSGYRIALEQYKLGTKYYVVDPIGNVGVGYHGQGWGRLTRRTLAGGLPASTAYSSSQSIADNLQLRGYLSTVKSDPLLPDFTHDIDTASKPSTQDFYLTVCTSGSHTTPGTQVVYDSSNPTAEQQGVEFALFAHLEEPSNADALSSQVALRCGKGFPSPADDVTVSGGTFNYAIGSTVF